MSGEQQTLPGLNDYLEKVMRESCEMEDLSREKHYSAERLLVSHPDRYKIARVLFFEVGLSKRGICDICKLNTRTLNAIIEREANTRGVGFLLERVRRKKTLIAYQLTEQLEDLANDPNECKRIGIGGLLSAIKLIQETCGKTIDVDPIPVAPSSNDLSDIQDYEKIHHLMSSSSNGLDSKKNSAASDDHDKETLKGFKNTDIRSILLSDDCHKNKELSIGVDNSMDKHNTADDEIRQDADDLGTHTGAGG